MKKSTIFIIAGIILIIGIFAYLSIRQKSLDARPFNKLEFKESIVISNYSSYERADTICLAISNFLYDFDSMNIQLANIPAHLDQPGDIEFEAFVQKRAYGQNQFTIFLAKGISFSHLRTVLSHEFIHINQYYSNRLEINGTIVIFEGVVCDLKKVDYKDRLYEIEAFDNQDRMRKELDLILYK